MSGTLPGGPHDDQRTGELAGALGRVHARIDAARAAAGRTGPDDPVCLVVVTKFFPAADVDRLAALGVRDIGENRDQEAAAKVADVVLRDRLTVHFIGQLQTNKVRSVVSYADVVQSVDRPKLARALGRAALEAGGELQVLVQVSLETDGAVGPDAGRGGVSMAAAPGLADLVAATDGLALRGVMAVAPLGADPARAFADLRRVRDGIQEQHPEATWMSAGMSGDLEAAVAAGATHLRVGTAILGSRPPHG